MTLPQMLQCFKTSEFGKHPAIPMPVNCESLSFISIFLLSLLFLFLKKNCYEINFSISSTLELKYYAKPTS